MKGDKSVKGQVVIAIEYLGDCQSNVQLKGSDVDEQSSRVFNSLMATAKLENCSLLLIKPHSLNNLHEIVNQVLSEGYEISALQLFHLDIASCREFLEV